jgi:hypothetical protein
MKTLTTYVFALLLVLGLSVSAQAQTNWQAATTLSAATTTTQNFVIVASATGITARTTSLWLPATGEFMPVTNVSGTTISVQRGQGLGAFANASAATVIVVPNDGTTGGTLYGACNGANARKYFQILNPQANILFVCLTTNVWQARVGTPQQLNHTMVITR